MNSKQQADSVKTPSPVVPEFRIYSVDQLFELPEPEWLVDRMLTTNSLAVLFGPGSAKSFAAVGIALSIATGHQWASKPVKKGRVIYVVGEGVGGIKKRVAAWKKHHGVTSSMKRALFIMEAPHLLDPEHVDAL